MVLFPADAFTGDITLWVKMLLPGINKRVYNLQSKQLVKLFSQVNSSTTVHVQLYIFCEFTVLHTLPLPLTKVFICITDCSFW